MIEDLQLVDKANWASTQLSGGMKRKLRCVHLQISICICISTPSTRKGSHAESKASHGRK